MSIIDEAIKGFEARFNCKPTFVGGAPGRVNLIGEHIDYNDGYVLPMAMSLQTIIVGCAVDGDTSTVVTQRAISGQSDEARFVTANRYSVDKEITFTQPQWSSYVQGVLELFPSTFPSFKAYIYSTVPLGSGLSSSAALEVATFFFLVSLSKSEMPPLKEVASICQKAEHLYAKVPCGIMDQSISTMGKAGFAMLLDCKDQSLDQVVVSSDNYTFVVFNTHVKHELAGGEYAIRRRQCDEVKKLLEVSCWREASLDKLEKISSTLPEVLLKRARHVIGEIKRVKDGVECLKREDMDTFGKLMVESHRSLQHDYDVSCKQLDELVDLCLSFEGVKGARMTGGGFGGCMVALVEKASVEKLAAFINEKYSKKPSQYFISSPEKGAFHMAL